MRLSNRLSIACFAFLGAVAPGNASSLLTDNFDTENGGVGQLNYSNFANFTVSNAATGGAVDLIGNGFFDFYPGNGLYLDICGSSSACGVFTTKQIFGPGNYKITLGLGGNARDSISDITDVSFGGNSTAYQLSEFQQATEVWNVSLASASALSIGDAGLIASNIGNILFSAQIESISAVPVPAALPLFASGLGLIGFWSRRKKQTASALATE
jgi:hypothetical protein